MSRIGRRPITIPEKVVVTINEGAVTVKGPLGELQGRLPEAVTLERKDKEIFLKAEASPEVRPLYGMARARLANMIHGVQQGFSKNLEVVGLGFKAALEGDKLILTIGFSHPVRFDIPKGVKLEIDKKQTKISVTGIDKDLVGQTAALIRGLRVPEPYKGTGIRYEGERIVRKAGKTAAGAGGGGAGAKK